MYNNHKIAIETITNKLKSRNEILGIIIGGYVAHGFANENSDINLMFYINNILENKTAESVEALYSSIIHFNKWTSSDKPWCIRFMLDSELNWMNGNAPIADL